MPETALITQQQFDKAKEIFLSATDLNCEPAPADEETLAGIISTRSIRIVVAGVDPYRKALYESLGRAKGALIARFGVGHNNIDKTLARQYGIIVTNTPGTLDTSVAEHTILLMGNLARHINKLDAQFLSGTFRGQSGMELQGKTLGIIGFGNIGKQVARIAHFGFGMRVIAVDSRPISSLGTPTNIAPKVRGSLAKASGVGADLDRRQEKGTLKNEAEIMSEYGLDLYTSESEQVFRQADIVSIHLPSLPDTRHFLNKARLDLMKPGTFLINTARGEIVDENELYDALSSGKLAGAALDVFENEPYQPVQPGKDLRQLKNVLLTPHIGSNTCEANNRMALSCLENIRNFLAGRYELLARVD